MTLRRCEACYGPGPALHDVTVQRYLCKKCHSTPDDPYFNTRCEACSIEAEIGTEEVLHPVDVRLHTRSSAEAFKQGVRMMQYGAGPERIRELAKSVPYDPSTCTGEPIETDEEFKERLIKAGKDLTIASELGTPLVEAQFDSLTAERDKYHRQAQDLEHDLNRANEEIARLRALAYIGEHMFPDLTWKARCAELVEERNTSVAPRDPELALKEIIECLERQLPQGVENAARHILACLDEFGRK